ncbi:MAG: GTP cyclohydrolase I, partial [Ignavibacteria bacterium]
MNKKISEEINKNHIDDDDFYYESDGQGQPLTSFEKLVKNVLKEIGEDPARPGLLRTPKRVADAYKFLTRGYKQNIESIVNGAIFNECYSEIVLVKDIDFFSLCEHHLLPFYGKCHIAY